MNARSDQLVSRKALLLDGSHPDDSTGERVRAALVAELQSQGWDIEHVIVRERKIGNCKGDFFCWIRTPGTCMLNDDNRAIAEAIVASDLLVYLTPVTFGGYSSALKRMVDHQIQNISPFFAQIESETHHRKRYEANPDFLAIGWMDAPDPQAGAIFHHLARRNAINFYAERSISGVAMAGQSDRALGASVQNWLDDLANGRAPRATTMPASGEPAVGTSEIRRALLLVGSPRTHKSTSNSLGGYMFERLAAQSIDTETVYLHSALHSSDSMEALLEAVDAADLLALAFPVYVDSLPAPVIEVLETIAARRRGREDARRPMLTAIANCGFPEAVHNGPALAICETFARQAGFGWAGGLALGGGEMVQGAPLAEMDGRAAPIRKSLDMAADALAQGQPIPEEARDIMAKPVIPAWMYRLMGDFGWRQRAKPYGAQKLLKQRPYAVEGT